MCVCVCVCVCVCEPEFTFSTNQIRAAVVIQKGAGHEATTKYQDVLLSQLQPV